MINFNFLACKKDKLVNGQIIRIYRVAFNRLVSSSNGFFFLLYGFSNINFSTNEFDR